MCRAGRSAPLPAAGRVQDAFQAQIAGLPAATQLLLLLAAADDTASLPVILRAGALLGVGAADLEPAERWIEIPEAGKTADDYEFPAPGLKILPKE